MGRTLVSFVSFYREWWITIKVAEGEHNSDLLRHDIRVIDVANIRIQHHESLNPLRKMLHIKPTNRAPDRSTHKQKSQFPLIDLAPLQAKMTYCNHFDDLAEVGYDVKKVMAILFSWRSVKWLESRGQRVLVAFPC